MSGLCPPAQVDPYEPARPLRILALSGGGYRGLFTAEILVQLETTLGSPLAEHFELIIGTSAGALLAAGIACGQDAVTLKQAFIRHGEEIFRRPIASRLRRLVWKTPYTTERLEAAIVEILGKAAEQKITDCQANLAITAVSQTHSKLRVFAGGDYAVSSSGSISVKEAILASAAAPTYFPTRRPAAETLIDGGVTANAPELVGMGLVNQLRGGLQRRGRVLGIGTAAPAAGRPSVNLGAMSLLGWMAPSRNLLLLTLEAQEDAAQTIARQLLQENYYRIDAKPSAAQAAVMGELDHVSKKGSETLIALAQDTWEKNKALVLSLLK